MLFDEIFSSLPPPPPHLLSFAIAVNAATPIYFYCGAFGYWSAKQQVKHEFFFNTRAILLSLHTLIIDILQNKC